MDKSKIKFASMEFSRIDPDETLPAKFERMLKSIPFEKMLNGKIAALKMHMGRELGYTTIHPLFVRMLIKRIREAGGELFITDILLPHMKDFGGITAKDRYSDGILDAPVYPAAGVFDKYYYSKKVNFKSLQEVQVSGNIHDAEVLINLSHVKGHGMSSFGGAIKNLAMGAVTAKTRHDLHALHSAGSGIKWTEKLCSRCNKCIEECRYKANKFNKDGDYEVFIHNCTYCQHCVEICPSGALVLAAKHYVDFQEGLAIAAQEVLKTFSPENVLHINVLMNITLMCDCWGMSTQSLVPDIGILASDDIVAIEKASLDMISADSVLPNSLPLGKTLVKGSHLFEKVWGKDPYEQIEAVYRKGLGNKDYEIETIK